MARPRKTAPEPTPEAITAKAEEQAASDAALLAALQNRDAIPAAPRRLPTIGDNFVTSAALIAQARRDTRLSEPTLIKLFELQMMWALNNRSNTQQSILDDEEFVGDESGGGEGEAAEAPTAADVNEVITAATED